MIGQGVVMLWCFIAGIWVHAEFGRRAKRKPSECDKVIVHCLKHIDDGERWAPPVSGFKVIGQTTISRGVDRFLVKVERIDG